MGRGRALLTQEVAERVTLAVNEVDQRAREQVVEALRREFPEAFWFITLGRASVEVNERWQPWS